MGLDVAALISFFFQGAFWVLLLCFTLHTLFLGYHWFEFGTSKQISLIALASYVSGGAILFMTLAVALTQM